MKTAGRKCMFHEVRQQQWPHFIEFSVSLFALCTNILFVCENNWIHRKC